MTGTVGAALFATCAVGAVAAAAGVTPATMPKKANVVITMMPILATGDAVRPRGEPLSGVMATPSL
jgi:hypothetical protein